MVQCISCHRELESTTCKIGQQFPSAIFQLESDPNFNLNPSSLDLGICGNPRCRLVQLLEVVDLEYVYSNYPYQTSTTATMRDILKRLHNKAVRENTIRPDDVILDIGGNDGTLLSNFIEANVQLVNIDTAKNIKQIVTGENYHYVNEKFSEKAYKRVGLKAPRIIFSSAVFYQLPDPNSFCQDIYRIMDDSSVLYLQMTYLGGMYGNNVFDNVVHEHIAYYSLYSLNFLLARHGLKIIDVSLNDVYGGSILATITRRSSILSTNYNSIKNLQKYEEDNEINEIDALVSFGERYEKWKIQSQDILGQLLKRHGQLVGLGASTKGNMLLQSLNLTPKEIRYVIDNNEKKIGTLMSGTKIPIVDESFLKIPTRAFFLLPYYYLSFFAGRLRKDLKQNESIEIFVPLPEPKIIEIWRDK